MATVCDIQRSFDRQRIQCHGRNILSDVVLLYELMVHLPILSASLRNESSYIVAGESFFASLRKAPSVI